MGLYVTMTSRRLLLLLDWDGTITQYDTLNLVAPALNEIKSKSPGFSVYQDEYMRDYTEFKTKFGQITNKEQMYDYLQSIRKVEERSLKRIHRLFEGTNGAQRRSRVGKICYRKGWAAMQSWMAQRVACDTLAAYIVSVNWSRTFISDALKACAEVNGVEQVISYVYANELATKPGSDECTGLIQGPGQRECILTGLDKEKMCEAIASKSAYDTIVYVGDSTTDIPCLLWADMGILIGSGDQVRGMLHQAGMDSVLHTIDSWKQLDVMQQRTSIVCASDWYAVCDLLQHQ